MSVIPKLIRAGLGNQPVPQHAVDMIREITDGWTVEYLRGIVEASTVPEQYIDTAVRYLQEHPAMVTRQKQDILAACKIVRPDLYMLLATPEGDKWLDLAGDRLGSCIIGKIARFFFSG